MPKHIITAMLAILLLLLTACASAVTPSADEMANQLQKALDTPIHGIMEVTNQLPDGNKETSVVEMWQNGLQQTRNVTLEDSYGTAGTVEVRNGDDMWFYYPGDNSYSHFELSDTPSAEEMGGQMTQMVEQMLERTDISYLGSGDVAGRETHELKFMPREGEDNLGFIPGETVISVDSETWYPLKIEIKSEEFGTMMMQYREIEFNPDFPPDTFTFVSPEGAEEVEMGMPDIEELTLEEARAKVPVALLEPTSLPEGFEFQSAQLYQIPENEEVIDIYVTLVYQNGIEELTIAEFYSPQNQSSISEIAGSEMEGKKVTVRGQEGYSMEVGMGMRGLIWFENELEMSIFGELSEEEMLKIAESMR